MGLDWDWMVSGWGEVRAPYGANKQIDRVIIKHLCKRSQHETFLNSQLQGRCFKEDMLLVYGEGKEVHHDDISKAKI